MCFRLIVVTLTVRCQLVQEPPVPETISRPTGCRRSLRSPRRQTARGAETPLGGRPLTRRGRRATTTRTRCDADCGTPSRRARDWRPPWTPGTGVGPPTTLVKVRHCLHTARLSTLSCYRTSTRSVASSSRTYCGLTTPCCVKNNHFDYLLYRHQIFVDFKHSFTDTISRKCAMKLLLNIPPQLKCVAALPCKI